MQLSDCDVDPGRVSVVVAQRGDDTHREHAANVAGKVFRRAHRYIEPTFTSMHGNEEHEAAVVPRGKHVVDGLRGAPGVLA